MALLFLLVIPFAATLAIVACRSVRPPVAQPIALVFSGAGVGVLAWLTARWNAAQPLEFLLHWMPAIGLDFHLWLDGTALFYAWVVMGIGFLVVFYARYYMNPLDSPYRFYSALMAFMGSMLGLVLSNNLVLMFLFWEMTSVTSYVLIAHWHHRPSAVEGARRALLLTAGGGLCLMAGIALLFVILRVPGQPPPSLTWESLWAAGPRIVAHPFAGAALLLLLLGAFTKSAQFPFHHWLPGAMEAPTPVSVFLHAATMVKAGIYLLGRIYPVFHAEPLWLVGVAVIGVTTMLLGGFQAIVSRDLKQLLAWSTVSQLGLLTAYYGLGYHRIGVVGHLLTLDVLLIASHALFKGGLFMLCGVIDHGTGTRDWTRLGGLHKRMPWTTLLVTLGCLSMAGMPLTLGFVAKKLYFEAGLTLTPLAGGLKGILFTASVVAGFFTMAYSMLMAIRPFWGAPRDREVFHHAHEGSLAFLAAPALLIFACVAAGLYLPLMEKPLALLVRPEFFHAGTGYKMAFFKKMDLLFWISLGTWFVGGPLIYLATSWALRMHARLHRPAPFQRLFDMTFNVWIPGFAGRLARWVQSPSLRINVAITLAVILGLMVVPLRRVTSVLEYKEISNPDSLLIAGLLTVSMLLLSGVIACARQIITRLIALGFVGFLVGVVYLLYKAPDLALTQVLVELVTLIMLLLLARRLGPSAVPALATMRRSRISGLVVAIGGGALAGLLTWAAAVSPERSRPIFDDQPTHANYYLANSKYPVKAGAHSGGGSNVVNVILVDLRGIDTLGEITVLVIAALGAASLLRPRRKCAVCPEALSPSSSLPEDNPDMPAPLLLSVSGGKRITMTSELSIIFRQAAPLVSILALAAALALFLSGHNGPGGGFIGGLLTAVAIFPFLMSMRRTDAGWPLRRAPFVFLPLGLWAAIGIGLAPMLMGLPFLRSDFVYLNISIFGKIGLATAMIFDLGVYFVVVGIALVILVSFLRARRHA
jgi:multicomponent K+:H+ antiporter subunit A